MAHGPPAASHDITARARTEEPDRYLAALLAPPAARPGLLALAAFLAEIRLTTLHVREPMMGAIRLQWWRDAVAAVGPGNRSGHPVADALGEAILAYDLPKPALIRLLDAHEAGLSRDLPADDQAAADYLEATEGVAFALAISMADPHPSAQEDAGAGIRSAALAYGLARGLGRLPITLARGGCILSADRLAAASIDPAAIRRQPPAPKTAARLENVVRGLETRARAALDEARGRFGGRGRGTVAALLPLAMVEPYFAAQNREGFRRLEQTADVTALKRSWRLWRAHRRGRF